MHGEFLFVQRTVSCFGAVAVVVEIIVYLDVVATQCIVIRKRADETYLRDIESERPSQAAQARELWLQTENLWTLWPGFVEALQRSRDGA